MSDQDIWSRGIRSAPRYEHRSGKNEFLGYLVQRDFAVTLTDFRPYARLLDGLFALHIEEIRRTFPSFSKADVETDKLRTAALADAWKKAEDMAAKLKTRVVTVFAVSPVEPGGIKDSILNSGRFVPIPTTQFEFESSGGALTAAGDRYTFELIELSERIHVISLIEPVKK